MDIWYVIGKDMWMYLENLGQYLVMLLVRIYGCIWKFKDWIFDIFLDRCFDYEIRCIFWYVIGS